MTADNQSADSVGDPLGIIGTVVAEKYQILALAGEGGFSLVYQARHLIWQQQVAIKFFVILEQAEQAVREQLLEDFIREGQLMSELSSRSAAIVQARDIGKLQTASGWIPYMVLEWLDGTPLDIALSREQREKLPLRGLAESLRLLDPVAAALDLAHRRNIAHRDLKPANIMLIGEDFRNPQGAKLLDFGIAKVMGEQLAQQEQLQKTGQKITAFTPHYGAPEQFSRSFGATGPWTDVYAMALILVELLRGQRALEGETFFELGVASSNTVRPTPGKFGIALSAELEAVFAKALAIAPAERYATMGAFWTELHRLLAPGSPAWSPKSSEPGLPSAAVTPQSVPLAPAASARSPASTGQPMTMPSANAPTVAATATTLPTPARKSSTPLIAVAAVLAAGAIAAGVRLTGTKNGTPPAAGAPKASAAAVRPAASAKTVPASIDWDGPCPKGMKPVNGGTFTMGSDDKSFRLWQPAHQVTLDTFCLDVTEVTVAAYRECVDKRGCKPADDRPSFPKNEGESQEDHDKLLDAAAELCNWNKSGRDNHPINCVDWYRADAYCRSRSFRLPTEAEWELAARGTDGRKFPWGDDPGDQTYMNAAGVEWQRWLKEKGLPPPGRLMYEKDDGFVGTAPVGHFPRAQTQSGQMDMVGNVWEWVSDWYALYQPDAQTNPKGPATGDRKAIRGGGFNGENPTWVNPAARFHQLATASVHAIGFRCASSVKPAQ